MGRFPSCAIAAICLVTLSAASCENGAAVKFSMQRVPKYYRDCVAKVTALPKERITLKEAVELLATLRASELRLSACGKATIRWADRQVDTCIKAGLCAADVKR